MLTLIKVPSCSYRLKRVIILTDSSVKRKKCRVRSRAKKFEGRNAKKARAISFDGILKVLRLGATEEFDELLTQGQISNINMTNARGETLLMIQCINHNLSGVKLLLVHGWM